RRHTRSKRDWSSDVCSSDLENVDMIGFIIKHKKLVVVTFFVLAIISIAVQFGVKTNFDMVDYLSDEAPSIKATDVMDEEFDDDVANTRVMIKDVSKIGRASCRK